MEFKLTYSGDMLRPQQVRGNARKQEKHALRLHFHEQLERIWRSDTRYSPISAEQLGDAVHAKGIWDVQRNAEKKIPYFKETPLRGFLYQRRLAGYRFVPMITRVMEAYCHLRILLRRPIRPGTIVYSGGDLDGRLKTLFDALAMPPQLQDLPEQITGSDDLCLCLLEGDELITGLSIDSEEWASAPSSLHAEVDITVTIRAVTLMYGTRQILVP
jgi:hypothetical protein